MLNYLWGGMILLGVIVGTFNGHLPDVTNAAITSAKDAVTLCITMLGILSMWTGIMNIANKSGLIKTLTKLLMPMLHLIFPTIPRGHKATEYIATNFIANLLGLGWAATPPGIMSMRELQKLNPNSGVASREMCAFMIINMSSLQLVSVNMLAYRTQYGSQNPSEIIGPGIFATLASTIAAIIFVKLIEAWEIKKCV